MKTKLIQDPKQYDSATTFSMNQTLSNFPEEKRLKSDVGLN
jgi:hypothetical protein